MRRNAAYGIVPTCAVGAEAQREGVLPTVVAEQYAQLLVEVDGTWASRVQQSVAERLLVRYFDSARLVS